MSDYPSNGHPESNSPTETNRVPRILPPQGQRAARGEVFEPSDAEIEVAASESISAAQTDADSPAVEDIYEPPLSIVLDKNAPDEEEDNSIYDYDLATDSSGNGGNGGDSNGFSGLFGSGGKRDDTPKDVELGLMDHLNELRVRLLWCALILMGGMCLTWNYSKVLQEWFAAPIRAVLAGKGVLISTNPTGFFSVTVQFSMVSALIITAPLLFWQVWRFIEPALTNSERRYSLILVPFSSILFFLGAGLGFAVSPLFFQFFVYFQPKGVAANWDYFESIIIMAKMLLVFGVMFQVPIIVIFLNKLGIVSRNLLIEYWRHAVVLIFIVVAILTPTWDPVTMTVCAVPPCLLYVLSIWLVKWL